MKTDCCKIVTLIVAMLMLFSCGRENASDQGSQLLLQQPHDYHLSHQAQACETATILRGIEHQQQKLSEGEIQLALCIGYFESKYQATTVGANRDAKGQITSRDWGVFQINDYWQMRDPRKPTCHRLGESEALRYDPLENAKCAVEVFFGRGRTFTAWATWDAYCRHDRYQRPVSCQETADSPIAQPKPLPPKVSPVADQKNTSATEIMCKVKGAQDESLSTWMKGCKKHQNNNRDACLLFCKGSCSADESVCKKAFDHG